VQSTAETCALSRGRAAVQGCDGSADSFQHLSAASMGRDGKIGRGIIEHLAEDALELNVRLDTNPPKPFPLPLPRLA